MLEDSRVYWIWFAEAMGQGSLAAADLITRFQSVNAIYNGAVDEMEPDEEFSEERLAKIKSKIANRSLDRANEIIAKCDKLGITIITYDSELYPSFLKAINNFPLVLYARGKMPDCDANMLVAVVGTRSMTDYGRKIAYSLGTGLAYGGAVVVSGMALGADSMALLGAMEAGGKTVTVLGSGVDVIYPKDHKEIYYKLMNNGAVISEYPPGTPPVGSHFPTRNRIMSGLSDATVVVEADETSGAMITANLAIDQGRKVFAVPGKVGDSGSEGPNLLIRDGALPCVCAEDILSEFEFIYKNKISVDVAHARVRKLDFETLSLNAMDRMRIGTSSGGKNYRGKGTYGGRIKDNPAAKAAFEESMPAEYKEIQVSNSETPVISQVKTLAKKEKRSIIPKVKSETAKKTKENIKKTEEKMIPASKIELDMLESGEIKVYNKMKPNVPVLPDCLVDADTSISDIMSALTMLEIAGAVESGGGGYFMRVSEEDIMLSQND